MQARYDNRIFNARGNTAFALDGLLASRHLWDMETADQILSALRDKGITQGEIAKVLGIKQPNAATLYTPGKNGKLRKLSYDEGMDLIREFSLEIEGEQPQPPSAEALEPILDALLPLAPPGRLTEQSRRALAVALSYGLASLGICAAKTTSEGEIAAAARAAAFRFREIALLS